MKVISFIAVVFLFFTTVIANDNGGLEIGDYAPNFSLKNIDGKMVSLSDYDNVNGFVIIFSCNHCPYVKLYEERMIELEKKSSSMGYPVIAINPNDPELYPEDSYEKMIERANEKGFTFPYLIDETQETAKAYGASRTPHTFLLKKEAEDKYKVFYIGAIDNDTKGVKKDRETYVINAITAIEKGEKPNPDFTKAIGCSIKWKK